MPTYNLVDRQWLPVTTSKGARTLASLDDIARHADTIRRVDLADPLERFATHRILQALWLASQGDMRAYLDTHHNLFDLYGQDRPFLQTPGLEPRNDPDTGLAPLHPLMRRTMWQPRDPHQPITPDKAAIQLITCMMYDVSGVHTGMKNDPRSVKDNKSRPKGPTQAARQFLTLIQGDTLEDTLRLNTLTPRTGDRPVWEHPAMTPDSSGITPTGPALAATWPSRRIRLAHDTNGYTTAAYVAAGDNADEQPQDEPCAFHNNGKPIHRNSYEPGDGGTLVQPFWTGWDKLMQPGNRPATIDQAYATGRDVITIETLDIAWSTGQGAIQGFRNDHLTITRERLDDNQHTTDTANRLRNHAWPRYLPPRKTKPVNFNNPDACTTAAFAPEDKAMRAWLAGGPEPERN
ncbi:hypothetical protein COO72_02440 [Bifidobacterium callitrichos]|nr:hypothetical protein COO72_02440 [Bifidobacterium callitrichos]